MAMYTSTLANELVEGLRKVFFNWYDLQPTVYTQIFDIQKSRKNKETDQTIAGIGMLSEKAEGDPITYDDFIEGYQKEYTHKVFAKGIRATQELIEDELYGILGRRTEALARAAKYRIEYDHASVFNNAVTAGYTGADGVVLLSASHTRADGGTNISNLNAVDLSQTALESAITHFRTLVDDRGMLIGVDPTILLIPPQLEFDAMELLKSTGRPYTTDNEINAVQGRLKPVVWNHLSGSDDWFVLAGKPNSFMRRPLSFDRDGDFDTGDIKMKCDVRYSYGWTDWRWCYGSKD